MISALKGRSYKFDDGLSTNSSNWYVVGVVDIPTRVDKVWDWRNPTPLVRPSFYSTSAYMCLPATYDGTVWNPVGEEVSFVPIFAVEQILEVMGSWREPSIVEVPRFYFNDEIYSLPPQQVSPSPETWYIEEIHTRPLRIDRVLDWRDLKDNEEPVFVLTSAGIGVQATATGSRTQPWLYNVNDLCYNLPMFLVTRVFEWRTTSTTGPQGPAGIQGLQGPRGPQGPQGPGSGTSGGGGGGGSVMGGGGLGGS